MADPQHMKQHFTSTSQIFHFGAQKAWDSFTVVHCSFGNMYEKWRRRYWISNKFLILRGENICIWKEFSTDFSHWPKIKIFGNYWLENLCTLSVKDKSVNPNPPSVHPEWQWWILKERAAPKGYNYSKEETMRYDLKPGGGGYLT